MPSCPLTCRRCGLELLVVALCVTLAVGFMITYIISVNDGHVTPVLPYISDTGGKAPESCVFSLLLCIAAFLVGSIATLKFLLYHQQHRYDFSRPYTVLNGVLYVFGLLAALGMIIVGCFQDRAVPIVHYIGAFLVFGFGVLYGWGQTLLAVKLYRAGHTPFLWRCTLVVRLLLCLSASVFFITCMVTFSLSNNLFHTSNSSTTTNYESPVHLVSTVTEWLMGLTFMLIFLTFHSELYYLKIHVSVYSRHESSLTISEDRPLLRNKSTV